MFFACTSFAQDSSLYSSEFYSYLKQQGLYVEQISYLSSLQPLCNDAQCADTLLLAKALCYFALQDVASYRSMVDSVKNFSLLSDKTKQENYIALLFSLKKITALKANVQTVDSNLSFNRRSKLFLQILSRDKINAAPLDSLVLNDYPLQGLVSRYKHQPHKSAMVAGLLSAIVPGLGKLYAGYKFQALSAFTTNAVFASQMTEAIVKSGFKSAHFAYTCSLFSLYYVGNIVGSVLSVKKKKRDYLNQLDDEIVHYYSGHLGAYAN